MVNKPEAGLAPNLGNYECDCIHLVETIQLKIIGRKKYDG